MASTIVYKNNLPTFVESTYQNLVRAIVDGMFSTAVFAYLTDKQMFCYVTGEGAIHIIEGLNWQIRNVTALPAVESGNDEVLYIKDGVVYTFNGEEYIPTYQKIVDKVNTIEAKFDNYYDKEYIDAQIQALKDLISKEQS